ncbi:hypothetical protein Hdeb2414_s0007g00238141 [Helianthus debilis subsp. tardiflorus]
MEEKDIDYVLVPLGLGIMIAYHIWLVYTVFKHPRQTVMGLNSETRHQWVFSMMADPLKNGVLAVQTIRNNIMASTLLATTAITLSSIISVFVSSTSNTNPAASQLMREPINYVARNLNRGSLFWSIGLRAFYFSFPLFLWIFGPIPMFVCCIIMSFVLYFLDTTTSFTRNLHSYSMRDKTEANENEVL